MMSESKSQIAGRALSQRIAQLSPDKRALLQRQLEARRRPGYDLVAQALQQCGISHVYGVAGLPTQQLLPAFVSQGMRPIGVYHHTSAVCMALAHNYQAGGLVAAVLVSAGPAVTNAMTGLLVARDNGWPVMVIGGQRSSFQRFDAIPVVNHLSKHAVRVPALSSVGTCIQEAAQIAISGRPGPVYVELHEDVLTGFAAKASRSDALRGGCSASVPAASDGEIETVAAALLTARRPALLLGKGVRWTVPADQLKELVEKLDLPLITSPMGRGFIPEDHTLCFNRARTVLQSQADVVLVLGARLNWVFRHGTELSRDAIVFRVDIHADEEDDAAIETQFIHGDAGDFVRRLLKLVDNRQNDAASPARRRAVRPWLDKLRAASDGTQRWLGQQTSSDGRPMTSYRMMKEVRDALPRDVICVTDGNISMMAAQSVIPAFRPASRMDAGTNACMGVGIPFAIGAKVACPDRPVVAVVGDYAFSLAAMEMEVCVRHNIPVVVVVANNQGNGGATKQKQLFPAVDAERVTMFQPGLEYDRIMNMFGGSGTTISDPDALRSAVADAIASGKPCCINVVIDPNMPLPNAWGEQFAIAEKATE
jgi:2-hydroxyacyl-CoA lyase 1